MNQSIIVFALSSSTELADEICSYLNINRGKCKINNFADGEILVEPEESVRGKHVFLVQSTCYPVSNNVMELLIALDACRRASAAAITCVIPYFGYARQDRKSRARQPITARLIADLLEVAGADRVVTIDLHAPQIQGFFKIPNDDLSAVSLFGQYFRAKHLEGEIVVVSPDHGGATRARKLAECLPNSTVAIIDKRRMRANVAESINLIGDVENKIAIVIDDIIDTGGSLLGGLKMIHEKGAKEVYCCCTHGVLSKNAIENIHAAPIKEMLLTNTIALPPEKKDPKIKVLSIAYMLAKTIEAIHKETPVSNIYDMFND
ncbi:MAG: ribose-phosphate pyrophosphokinase [Erysipelotrichaceae bacterium]|nr:ribose-phosphate pyrophosphokinase [Erysipelotrichaceae bacterium]MDD3924338.1 ribose-phosphate pyrophosphokinase [Erysipelotrichaceae bacterium]MDD4643104.1 ribose-phosphate pyrophosphokinase [Erysipelotrichaceae bacterium]